MNMFRKMLARFKSSEKAQGMVEYGLILALVSVVAVGALGGIGGKIQSSLGEVSNGLGGAIGEPSENVETTKERIEIIPIDFEIVEEEDWNMAIGQSKVRTPGVKGERKKVYIDTFVDGVFVSEELISDEVIKEPENQVVLIGTSLTPGIT